MQNIIEAVQKNFNAIPSNIFFTIIALCIISLLFFISFLYYRKRCMRFASQEVYVDKLLQSISSSKPLEANLSSLLNIFIGFISSDSYSFYIIDETTDEYVLKAIKHSDLNNVNISPSYSGLVKSNREVFFPPSSQSQDVVPKKISIVTIGDIPLLTIPINGNKGFIQIGPLKKISKKTLRISEFLSKKFEYFLGALIDKEKLKNKVELIVSSSTAVSNVSNILSTDGNALSSMLSICVKTILASGGLFVTNNLENKISSFVGLGENFQNTFESDSSILDLLFSIVSEDEIIFITKDEDAFARFPSYFVPQGTEAILIINVEEKNEKGVACFWYTSKIDYTKIDEFRMTALVLITKKLRDIIDNCSVISNLSRSYIDGFKNLSQMIDNLSPYTIGYSELMTRYSIIIARELNLPDEMVRDIGQAAYLSNIGIIGLSNDLFKKGGKFNEIEYEMMKLHSDVGASIIESTTGNSIIANYIRHHHERYDGKGYPSGLKGKNIPLGSSIIALVQTFLAKISEREDRNALPFEKCIKLLEASDGTQHDPDILKALINWLKRKQEDTNNEGHSLGTCWEMRCSPEEICRHCSVYHTYDKNCWEHETNNCEMHGNTCETCFIRTEFVGRKLFKSKVL